jgi:hypothetical protein
MSSGAIVAISILVCIIAVGLLFNKALNNYGKKHKIEETHTN